MTSTRFFDLVSDLQFRITQLRLAVMCGVFLLTFMPMVHGQTAQRTFVSTFGSDANTVFLCSAANPCRNFAFAQTVTAAGGEIIALTSGGYGPVEITKAIQITAPTGVYAAITALPGTAIGGTDAIRISAGVNDVVVLRGLTVNNLNVDNADGINFDSGLALHVESCVINGFTNTGILFDAPGRLFVKDTVVRNGEEGILVFTNLGAVQGTIDRSRFENNVLSGAFIGSNAKATIADSISTRNAVGFWAMDGGELTVTRTVAANNLFYGFRASGSTTTRLMAAYSTAADNVDRGFAVTNGGQMVLDNCVSQGNTVGIDASGLSTIARVSNTTVTGNGRGLSQFSSAVFESYGNNRVRGNTTETSGTITHVGKT